MLLDTLFELGEVVGDKCAVDALELCVRREGEVDEIEFALQNHFASSQEEPEICSRTWKRGQSGEREPSGGPIAATSCVSMMYLTVAWGAAFRSYHRPNGCEVPWRTQKISSKDHNVITIVQPEPKELNGGLAAELCTLRHIQIVDENYQPCPG